MDQRENFDSEQAVKADVTASFQRAQNPVQFSGPMEESLAPALTPVLALSTAPAPTPTPAPTTSCSTKGKKKGRPGHSKFQYHVLTANPGEDVLDKIMSLYLQAPHGICILQAYGTLSKVTICGEVSGETSTFEGLFNIISFTGSIIPLENGSIEERCGGLNVWFGFLNGDFRGGAVAGSMIAAKPVMVVVGSFSSPGNTSGKKAKTQKA